MKTNWTYETLFSIKNNKRTTCAFNNTPLIEHRVSLNLQDFWAEPEFIPCSAQHIGFLRSIKGIHERDSKMATVDEKIQRLLEIEGYSDFSEWAEDGMNAFDSVCPAICMNEDCDYTCEMEPDQDRGWCEVCEANTMKSLMILMEII